MALSWCFPDEDETYAREILHLLRKWDIFVPAIWPLEVANALVVAERKKRIRAAEATRFLSLIQSLEFTVDPRTPSQAVTETIALARRHTISAYDAAYLELAIREDLPLATLDGALKKIARKLGVKLLSP